MTDVYPGATLVQTDGFFARHGVSPQEAFSVVHHTASTRSAESEVRGRQVASGGVTATFFVDPDGTPWQQLGDPLRMAPWTNGVLNRPDTGNPRIADVVQDKVNPNLRSLVTIENVAVEAITPAQERTSARIIAYYHGKAGVPVTRETIIGHYQLDSVNRPNCPQVDKSVLDRIVKGAQAMAPGTKGAGTPIGSFRWAGSGHLLISPTDPTVRFSQSLNPGPFEVLAVLDLVDADGDPIDIDLKQPPQGNRDEVYLVDLPSFGASAWVLRADGVFTPRADSTAAAYNEGLAAAQAAVEALPER